MSESEVPKELNFSALEYNIHFKPNPPSKRLQKVQDDINQFNFHAQLDKEQKDIDRQKVRQTSTPIFLVCKYCEGKVKRRKKPKIVQIGLQSLTMPQYRCSVCSITYSGFLPHIKSDKDPEIECEIIEYSGLMQ